MRTITALQVQKKNPNRVSIHLDGEYAFGVDRVVAGWLQVGQVLEEEKIRELQIKDARERALQQAFLYLSYRARSEAEVRGNLQKHAFPEPAIEAAMASLRRDGYVDDAQFARTWVENRVTFRPRSRRALAVELRQKGVTDEAIACALEGLDESELAYSAARAKARKIPAEDWQDFRKKIAGFLARRGFSYAVIDPTLSRLWEQLRSEREPQLQDDEERP